MCLSLLAGDSFEVLHIGGLDGGPDDAEEVEVRYVVAALVVRHEKSQVLHVLELDKPQVYRVPFLKGGMGTKRKEVNQIARPT